MQTKSIFTAIICLLFSYITTAQTHNPYKSIGKKGKVLTLTNGEYDEFFDEDSIQRIGSAFVNINTMKVVKVQLTKEEKRQLDNSLVSRFLSVDPLTRSFPMLTPYQYASNTPIQAIDLDGLEGVKYDVSYQDNGKTKIKTVVELDVYIGISKNNASKYQSGDEAIVKSGLEKEYNQDFEVDNKKVEFKFNVKTFDVDATSVDKFAKNLEKTSKVETGDLMFTDANTGKPVYRTSITGVAIDVNVVKAGSTTTQGFTNLNKVNINSTANDKRHTESHELGHFLLLGSKDQPNTAREHNSKGGIFTYKEVDEDGNVTQDVQGMTKSNIKLFLKNIPTKASTTSTAPATTTSPKPTTNEPKP